MVVSGYRDGNNKLTNIISIIKLFCFPYAGGSATIFNKWRSYFNVDSDIELVPLELSRRGKVFRNHCILDCRKLLKICKADPLWKDTFKSFKVFEQLMNKYKRFNFHASLVRVQGRGSRCLCYG
jgi:hypothetical protein